MQNSVLPWSVSRSAHHSEQSASSTGDLRHAAQWWSHTDPLPRKAPDPIALDEGLSTIHCCSTQTITEAKQDKCHSVTFQVWNMTGNKLNESGDLFSFSVPWSFWWWLTLSLTCSWKICSALYRWENPS